MAENDGLLPESSVPGLIPTLNKTGWMTEKLDRYSRDFAAYAGTLDTEVLDIGCAYGIATLAAVEAGATVCACDIEAEHLEILAKRIPEADRDRVRTVVGAMPAIDFPSAAFGAVLAARVLHFLDGPAIEATVAKMFDWLQPGGRVYLIGDTPYTGPWYIHAERYEARKAAGDEWPGFVDDYAGILPEGVDPTGHPEFINPLDPDILRRVSEHAGFDIISAEFLPSAMRSSAGREHAGVIARKPG